jgi:hypothetical protein
MDELRRDAPVRRSRLSRNSWKETTSDGLIKTTMAFQAHEDKLYIQTEQENRDEILEHNKRLRAYSKDHTRFRRGLDIPEEDFGMVIGRFPDLVKGTPDEKRKAMSEVMATWPEYVVIEYNPKYHAVS